MTSAERIQNCMELKPVKDRRDIPLYPQLISYPGKFAGITQKEMVNDPNKFMQALKITFDHFGIPDLCINMPLGDIIFSEGLPARRPGHELTDDAQFQFVETQNIDDGDYKKIMAEGWDKWFNGYMCRIQNPPLKGNLQLTLRWIKLGMHGGKLAKFLEGFGTQPIASTAMFPLFDQLSLIRSFEPFCMDLYDEPDMIKRILEKETPGITQSTLKNAARGTVKRVSVYAMRSDASVISPAIFDEFAFPYLKQTIEELYKAGYLTVLHADGNWVPMLGRFLSLPKGSIHFEFDGVTDLFKARDILDGHHSMRGDVPATMLAFGTPDEVSEYCEKLITGIGMKGGFILGSGCEVPMNCKPENLMAFMKAAR